MPHTVTADPALAHDPSHARVPAGTSTFNSGNVAPGAEYRRTFTVAGTYDYFCIPHELAGMLGTVIVMPSRRATRERRSARSGP